MAACSEILHGSAIPMPPTISPRSMKGRSRCEVKARIRSSLMQDPLQQKIRRRSVINGKQCASRLFGQRRVVGTGVRAPLWLEDGKRQEDDRVGIERMNDNYFGKLGINGVDEGCCQRQRITGNTIAINYCGRGISDAQYANRILGRVKACAACKCPQAREGK